MSAGSITQAEVAPVSQSWVAHHPRWVVGWMILVMTGGALCVGSGRVELGGTALPPLRPSGSDRRMPRRPSFR